MSLSHSPKIVTKGLVYYHDMGNTQKSFKGAPTTNIIAATPLTSWSGTSIVADVTVTGETYKGGTVYRLADADGVNPDVYVDNFIMYNNVPNLTLNDQYTFSLDVKVIKKSNVTNSGAANSGIWNWYSGTTEVVNFKDLPLNVWTRIEVTCTVGATYNYLIPRIDYDNSIVEVANVQFEKQSFATPYVNGTRSNTQAIIDLSNNNTITANSLTYNSDNTFSFNGTADYMTAPVSCDKTYYSINWWIRPSAVTNYNQTMGFNTSNIQTWGAFLFHTTSTGGIYVGTTGADTDRMTPTNLPAGTLAVNTWQNFCWTFDNGNAKFYKNGNLLATKVLPLSVLSAFTSFTIGTTNSTTINGSISNLSIYSNKVLNDTEVQQNFNALRGRYGL